VHPGRYTVRLTVDGTVTERHLEVRRDPRVTATAEDLRQQFELSMTCYRGYATAQDLREAIDAALGGPAAGPRQDARRALRGVGQPENPDILYGSITRSDPATETVVSLQQKFLFMMNLVQGADARPTAQAADAVRQLTDTLAVLEQRWSRLR
jgi:hypothetical protein